MSFIRPNDDWKGEGAMATTPASITSFGERKPSTNPWFAPDAKYLYELRRLDEDPPHYDANHGVVVIAVDSKEARQLAADVAKDEGRDLWLTPAGSSLKKIGLARKPNGKDAPKSRVVAIEDLNG